MVAILWRGSPTESAGDGARLAHHHQPTQSEILSIVWQPLGLKLSKIRPRLMKRRGIREAVADLHFEIVRAAAVIPNGWDHATVNDVHMDLVKPAGAPEPVNQRLSRNELLPQRSQRLNLLACLRRHDQD